MKERKNCQNCGKPIETGSFCSEECGKAYHREPKGAKPLDVNNIAFLTDKQKEAITTSQDFNANLILKAVETKTEITLFPRRSHTIRGIPILYDSNTCRVYVNTGRTIETVLLSEIGHFSFPLTLL